MRDPSSRERRDLAIGEGHCPLDCEWTWAQRQSLSVWYEPSSRNLSIIGSLDLTSRHFIVNWWLYGWTYPGQKRRRDWDHCGARKTSSFWSVAGESLSSPRNLVDTIQTSVQNQSMISKWMGVGQQSRFRIYVLSKDHEQISKSITSCD